jgi:hypothetical protein
MTALDWTVAFGGLVAIAIVNWFFFLAGKRRVR